VLTLGRSFGSGGGFAFGHLTIVDPDGGKWLPTNV
jgi:hypothetical protein